MPDKECTVYGLRESGANEIRYIGQTGYSLTSRLKRHWQEANNGNKTARSNWMRSVRDRGGEIEAVPIEENAEWNAAEIKWIAEYRERGARLLNHTDGGQGWTPGKPKPKEWIPSYQKAQRKSYQNPEVRKRHKAAVRRHIETPEGQAKMEALQELVRSKPEYEERRLSAIRESRKDPEFRRRMAEKAKEQMADPKAREHLAQVNRERMKDPRNRKMASENAKKGWNDPAKKAERCRKLKLAAQKRWERVRAERGANG